AARAEDRAALDGYLPVGHPTVAGSCRAFEALCGVGGDHPGVDLVEVGMPYSDPVMDGSTVQRATTRALANGLRTPAVFTAGPAVRRAAARALAKGVRARAVFAAVEAVAATGTPAVVMSYWNLVERYGVDAFARDLAAAGGSGLITPDVTPDEAEPWLTASE